MRSKLCEIISGADQFGALSQISFLNNDVKFRSIYGGLLSIMIYLLGLTYFLYLMIMWQTYQIPPSVTNQQQTNTGPTFYRLQNPIFYFSLEAKNTSDKVANILNKQKNLYDLNIQSTDLDDEIHAHSLEGQIYTQNYSGLAEIDPICINLNDQYQTQLHLNPNNRSDNTFIDFYINQCNPSANVNCLSFEDQTFILEQPSSYWRLTLITQDVDIQTGEIKEIEQDYYFNVRNYSNPGSTFNFGLKLKRATYIIDTGVLFSNERTIEIIKHIDLTIDQDNLIDPLTNFPVIADITYSLDRQEEIIRVTYPKLGQILADLGSIVQVLLLLGLLMNWLNANLMKVKILNVLFQIYFPQSKFFDFKYDWKGKLQSIFFKGEALENVEYQQIKTFRENTDKQLTSKLNYINILHEISRLQIQLQQKLPKQELVELQQSGYSMDLPFQDQPGYIIAEEQYKLLDQEDFRLLIYQTPQNIDKQDLYKIPLTIETPEIIKQCKLSSFRRPIIQMVK